MYELGFTGTQNGATYAQLKVLSELIVDIAGPVNFHHGDCVGADTQAADVAFTNGCVIVLHPPTNNSKRGFNYADFTRPAKPYLERNRDIVDECDSLVAMPEQSTKQLRSGTWSTVRYARKQGKPVRIIYPDGCTLLQ